MARAKEVNDTHTSEYFIIVILTKGLKKEVQILWGCNAMNNWKKLLTYFHPEDGCGWKLLLILLVQSVTRKKTVHCINITLCFYST
jgi:hypothetical protein